MGFLMGAYGKLMAGQRARSIQYQLTTIQSRLRRVTREIGDKEKMYQAQERNMKTMMQAQMQAAIYGYMGLPMGANPAAMDPATAQQMWGSMDMTQYSQYAQAVQMQFASANSMWQQAFELQRDADLNALKDLEESLQLEKDSLESQLKIAEQDYQANKEMEKQGAEKLKPDYTGQG